MSDEHKTVFISYRRNVASFIARAIFLDLREHGYDVFMDVESIDSGDFNQIIFNQIEARAHFVLILTPGTLDNCVNPNDAVRKEIEYAMDKQRNIVPLLVNEFSFAGTEQYLTGQLTELPHFNGLNVPHDYFDAAMERLRTRFLKQPTVGVVKPAPASDQSTVQQKIKEVVSQPTPTTEQLDAEELFYRAYQKGYAEDLDGAIDDYTEVLRLNPKLVDAYNNRGVIREKKDDLDGAFADYSEAIRLSPEYFLAYVNRGRIRYLKGDFEGAIADFTEALRLKPNTVAVYYNRGSASYHQGLFDEAIRDWSKVIELDSKQVGAYSGRGEVYFAKGDFDKALEDFRQSNNLRPAFIYALAGLAITHAALRQKAEAKRIWNTLLAQDQRYRDADWVGKELNWHPILIEAARKLIAEL